MMMEKHLREEEKNPEISWYLRSLMFGCRRNKINLLKKTEPVHKRILRNSED